MLLVANLANAKWCKNLKMTETLAHGYSSESTQRELSNEYQHGRVWMFFKNLCILVLWTKVASALEGLITTVYTTVGVRGVFSRQVCHHKYNSGWWPMDQEIYQQLLSGFKGLYLAICVMIFSRFFSFRGGFLPYLGLIWEYCMETVEASYVHDDNDNTYDTTTTTTTT